ncbi:MAG: family 16 glycoside hydrolase [Pseudomonadota bacterium]
MRSLKTTTLSGFFLSLVWIAGCASPVQQEPEASSWIDLFDAETLNGWRQVNGAAPYEVVDGAIRGTNILDDPNSFLASEGRFANFVLEFESRSIGDANTGVQFRTDLAPGTWSGVVGYQLDIDPTARRWTGGIYHEGVHRWRHSMARNPACQAAYQHGEWNTYRIEAIGPTIATWVNEVPCAHMIGDHHTEGLIALQVHAIGQDENLLGSYTEWRNIRLLADPSQEDLWQGRRAALIEGWLTDDISSAEADRGWQTAMLSDGSAVLEGPSDAIEFVVDMQLAPGTIGHMAYEVSNAPQCSGEFTLRDETNPDMLSAETERMGSLSGVRAANNLSEPGRPLRIYSDDRWNRVRIIVSPGTVEHWLNGVNVAQHPNCALDPADAPNIAGVSVKLETSAGEITIRNAKYRLASD